MPRVATGTVIRMRGQLYGRFTFESGRKAYPLPMADEDEARAFVSALAELAKALRVSGNGNIAEGLVSAVVEGRSTLEKAQSVVEQVAAGKLVQVRTQAPVSTFADVAKLWTSGKLAEQHRDHVRVKKSAALDRGRLDKYVLPLVGSVAIAKFTREHADQVMRALPVELRPATRRQVARLVSRVLSLSVEPLRLRDASPIAAGWVPKVNRDDQPQQELVFPDELDALCSSPAVPLVLRLFAGIIGREGFRRSEAEGLDWANVDLARGVVRLHENKTGRPRTWALRPDSARALRRWHALRGQPKIGEVFVLDDGAALRTGAEELRGFMLSAGVDRRALHEGTKTTKPAGWHALRSLFVTEALAHGRDVGWVRAHTGHSLAMLERYQRDARTFVEASIAHFGELDALLGWEETAASAEGIGSAEGDASELSAGILSGSGAWNRTTIQGFKVLCPAIERRRKGRRT